MTEPTGGLTGPVQVIGAGLVGTSIALALSRTGIECVLADERSDNLRTAAGLGAGRPATPDDRPQLVVVAVPPDHLGAVIRLALEATAAYGAVVTDVGSIKTGPLAEVAGAPGVERYVGGHPMAGSERSGPLAASAALFDGRPWAVTAHEASDPDAVALVEELVRRCGAVPVRLSPVEHDAAVARTSHVPHLLASLAAGRLAGAPGAHLTLSGQGVRDVTRVAAGDPVLYGQIVSANADQVLALLTEVRGRLDEVIAAVGGRDRPALEALLAEGVAGTRAIPGKHGGPVRPTQSVFVSLPDHPGELARLFADAGESGVNIEDVRIDHDPGRATGLVELVVEEDRAEHLLTSLEAKEWVTHR
jgi:prephenate dehydrogenase